MIRSDYYVYALLDPSKGDVPFYIGKGRGYRKINHYCSSYLRHRCHKSHIIKAYRSRGFPDKHTVLAEGLTENEAFDVEKREIARIGRLCDGGTLVNQSAGGEGASGFSTPRTPEWRAKISAAHKGRKKSEAAIANSVAARLGKPLSEEHRQKLSESLRGKPKTEAHRLAAGAAKIGRKMTPEHRAKILPNLVPGNNAKWHRIVSPDGAIFVVKSLRQFCIDRNLSNQHLGQVALGRRNHHYGWTASFCKPPCEGKADHSNG